ncbi:DEKNAAC104298 [Brettanomyces naardenensis]|uniref:DEKNAAC104298 n=1 Tax=Brettanomyces naardenensis TaxID=13370 RepID=A0A448YQ43_BRENA|nr:DEKNAAC104298 [Brettanomyces naardenensis]
MPDYDVSYLLQSSTSSLLSAYSVQDLEYIKGALTTDVANKKLELRDLVGSKYRELLKAADDIVTMDQLVRRENEELIELTFRRASYNSKSLQNLSVFHKNIAARDKQEALSRNRVIIFRNVVHDCIYSYYNLQDSLKTELAVARNDEDGDGDASISSLDSSPDTASSKFIHIAKQLCLVFNLFDREINDPDRQEAFSVQKIKSLRKRFLNDITYQLTQLSGGYEYQFASNLMTSYVILTQISPEDSLIWFLNLRKTAIFNIDASMNFQLWLSYVFVTLNYLSSFKTRLPAMLARHIYGAANSNWITQSSSLRKWCTWLNIDPTEYTVDFPLTASQLNIQSDVLDCELGSWKQEIDDNVFKKLSKSIEECLSLKGLSGHLSRILTGFKTFSSLVLLQCSNNLSLLDELISVWQKKYLSILRATLKEFGAISELILDQFTQSEKLEAASSTYGTDLFEDVDVSNVDKFVTEVSNPDINNSVIEPILVQINAFKADCRNIIISLDSLTKTASKLEGPVISIDDSEDSEFWLRTGTQVQNLVNDSIEFAINELNQAITLFFDRVDSTTKDPHQPVEYLYMIRIIVHLKKRLELSSIYSSFSKISTTEGTNQTLEINHLAAPLLTKLLIPLVGDLSKSCKEELSKMALKDEDNSSTSLWETFDGKGIPTAPSMELENILYKVACQLLEVNNSDYSDVYLIEEFEPVKQTLLDELLKIITDSITGNSKTVSLIAYADMMFILCFKAGPQEEALQSLESTNPVVSEAMEKLFQINPDLRDKDYRSMIIGYIVGHFKTVNLMYYPLS